MDTSFTAGKEPITFAIQKGTTTLKRKADGEPSYIPDPKKVKLDKVQCLHILAKHKDSRNPSSWREKSITRTKDEAKQIIRDLRAKIVAGELEFEATAQKMSDCSSAKRGGDLGPFGRNEMQPAFEKAA